MGLFLLLIQRQKITLNVTNTLEIITLFYNRTTVQVAHKCTPKPRIFNLRFHTANRDFFFAIAVNCGELWTQYFPRTKRIPRLRTHTQIHLRIPFANRPYSESANSVLNVLTNFHSPIHCTQTLGIWTHVIKSYDGLSVYLQGHLTTRPTSQA